MSKREGTGSKPVGRRPDKARAKSQRTNNYDEPPGPFPTLGPVRNRDTHEGLAAVQYRGNAGQVSCIGTPLTRVLAASLAAGTSVDGIPTGITQIIRGGTGGNGGNGFGRGIGGIGGVGQGPSFQIDRFYGTQNIILGSKLPVPRGVSDHLFWVMDPEGGYIPVSLRYCHNYQDLDKHIKTALNCSRRAGASHVNRGDYMIVSEDGSFIVPVELAQTVKAHMLLEISILQRQVQSWSNTIQKAICPDCGTQAMATGNGWFKCTTCMRNYRMDEQDQDMEDIMSPQLVQPNEEVERKLFRRVHIYIYRQQKLQFSPPQAMSAVSDRSPSFVQQGWWEWARPEEEARREAEERRRRQAAAEAAAWWAAARRRHEQRQQWRRRARAEEAGQASFLLQQDGW